MVGCSVRWVGGVGWWVGWVGVCVCVCVCCSGRGQPQDKVSIPRADAEPIGEKSGKLSTKLKLEDKTLRSCCENAAVISVLMLSDSQNHRVVSMIVSATMPISKWHTAQNRELRKADATVGWIQAQVKTDFMAHVLEMVQALCNPGCLEAACFLCDYQSLSGGPAEDHITEDDVADTFGSFNMELSFNRQKRCLFFWGWPVYMNMVVGATLEFGNEVTAPFWADAQAWRALLAIVGKTKVKQLVCDRHFFNLKTNQQWIAALTEFNFQYTAEFGDHVSRRGSGIAASQLIEDIIGIQKNNRVLVGNKLFRRPQVSMAHAIKSNVVSIKHKFETISSEDPIRGSKCHKVSRSAFRQKTKERSIPELEQIQSTNAATPWHSPLANDWVVPVADLHSLRLAHAKQDFGILDTLWLGGLVQLKHKIGVRKKGTSQWYIAGHHLSDSCVLAWPCPRERVHKIGGATHSYFALSHKELKPTLIVVYDIAEWEACSYQWRSWKWQYQMFNPLLREPGVRPFCKNIVELKKVAAQNAFWTLPTHFLVKLSPVLGAGTNSGSLVEVLEHLIMHVLKVSEQEAMCIMAQRLAADDVICPCSEMLLQVGEAVQVLDKHDHKVMVQEQKDAITAGESRQMFVSEFKERRKAVGLAALKKMGPKRLWGAIQQAHAKKFIPPQSSIWKDNTRGGWCGHMPPRRRIACHEGSEFVSMQSTIKTLWSQFVEIHGIEVSDVPIDGLFWSSNSCVAC